MAAPPCPNDGLQRENTASEAPLCIVSLPVTHRQSSCSEERQQHVGLIRAGAFALKRQRTRFVLRLDAATQRCTTQKVPFAAALQSSEPVKSTVERNSTTPCIMDLYSSWSMGWLWRTWQVQAATTTEVTGTGWQAKYTIQNYRGGVF